MTDIRKKLKSRFNPIQKETIRLELKGPDGELKEEQVIVKDAGGRIIENRHIVHRRQE